MTSDPSSRQSHRTFDDPLSRDDYMSAPMRNVSPVSDMGEADARSRSGRVSPVSLLDVDVYEPGDGRTSRVTGAR